MTATIEASSMVETTVRFELRPELEAHEPPEARGASRDDVRLLVSRTAAAELSEHAFAELPDLLLPGDVVVVNNSATIPAAVNVLSAPADIGPLTVHFSTAMVTGEWLVELRSGADPVPAPFGGGSRGLRLELPGGAALTLTDRFTQRLWLARLSTAVIPYLLRHGHPIRYSYVPRSWPIEAYQTVFATIPGSAEMPSAARPFTPQIVTRLVSRGVAIAPITLHTGVSSLEGGESPYPESYDVPAATSRLVNLTRQSGGRVIAAGTTVVRALESAALATGPTTDGVVAASAGWTSHVVTRETGAAVVDGLLTGLHEPLSTHLWMLAAFADDSLLSRAYEVAAAHGYRWHEFGDVHLLLP
ncbi:MAG TPA: S-adenosylmethionine:tRNA ribosyltransferase-isomerase [Streptosporangiaceae bacterium]|nr:S-adenosylmethionine:tRNA ribosyltransferase-isomerase [Streptosporangiaceae bacterium]